MSEQGFRPPSLVLATIGLSLATFMQVLDTTIANVALPTISGNLGVSSEQGTWVITSFAVSNSIALPLTGWMSRRMGQAKLFLASVLLFIITSFLCGIAQNMTQLVIFRALQGFFAGPLYPMAQTLLLSIYPAAKRGMALSLLAMVTVVAPIVGPLAGCWITDNYTWPWIFFINVPIGVFAAMLVLAQLKDRPETTVTQPIDYVGLALLVLVIWELTDKHPIIDLRLFKYRNFSFGTLALVLGYSGFFGINLLLPQWLQTQLGYTPVWDGLAAAPIGILPVFLSPLVGRYAHKFDLRLLAGGSFW